MNRRKIPLTALIIATCTAFVLSCLLAFFFLNNRIVEKALNEELERFARKHVASLENLIQQDLVSGFYPSVVQKTTRFVDNDLVRGIVIRVQDDSETSRSFSLGDTTTASTNTIVMPIYSNNTSLRACLENCGPSIA